MDNASDAADGQAARPPQPGEQNEPLLEQNSTTDAERLAGIVEQTRADLDGADLEKIIGVLKQRLEDAAIPLSDDGVRALADRIVHSQGG